MISESQIEATRCNYLIPNVVECVFVPLVTVGSQWVLNFVNFSELFLQLQHFLRVAGQVLVGRGPDRSGFNRLARCDQNDTKSTLKPIWVDQNLKLYHSRKELARVLPTSFPKFRLLFRFRFLWCLPKLAC